MRKEEKIIVNIELTENDLQEFAEYNIIERKLTGIELNRIKRCFYDFDDLLQHRSELMDVFITYCTNDEHDWGWPDDDYIKSKSKQ